MEANRSSEQISGRVHDDDGSSRRSSFSDVSLGGEPHLPTYNTRFPLQDPEATKTDTSGEEHTPGDWQDLPASAGESSNGRGNSFLTLAGNRTLDIAAAVSHRALQQSKDWLAGFQQTNAMEAGGSNSYGYGAGDDWPQAGAHADAQDLAGPGEHGRLECRVSKPQREGEGTQNSYISYLVSTEVC